MHIDYATYDISHTFEDVGEFDSTIDDDLSLAASMHYCRSMEVNNWRIVLSWEGLVHTLSV